jgi:hypothetical protein
MTGEKPFWASWTLWGAVATFLGVLLPGLGLNADPANITSFFQSFQQMLDSILTFGGLAAVVYGRATATKELTKW